jgi:hypothetical protein
MNALSNLAKFSVVAIVSHFLLDAPLVTAQSEYESATLMRGEAFFDSASGCEIMPYLVQNKVDGAVFFASTTVPVLRIQKSIPFLAFIKKEAEVEVGANLAPITFPTKLAVSGIISLGDDYKFELAYELDATSFEKGKEFYSEKLCLDEPQLPPNEPRQFEIIKGRVLVFTFDGKHEPIPVEHIDVAYDPNVILAILEDNEEDDEKVVRIIKYVGKLIDDHASAVEDQKRDRYDEVVPSWKRPKKNDSLHK